jgi:predicted RNA-binding protein with EMAP domain
MKIINNAFRCNKQFYRKMIDDEDINTLATIIPSVDILGPITRSRAQQLNHQVNSFLCTSAYNNESRLLPNDLIVLRNKKKTMEDKQSIKKVLESQGDVHEKVANQSNSELPSSSPTRSPGPPRIQIDVQIAYDLRFGHSTYARKAKEITFLMAPVSCPAKIEVIRNHQNTTNF